MREELVVGGTLAAVLLVLNVWMTRRVMRAPSRHLPHKGLVLIGLWLMPFLGVFTTRSHLLTYVPGETHRHLAKRWQSRVVGEAAPEVLELPGAPPLNVAGVLHSAERLPLLDGPAARAWLMAIPDAATRAGAVEAMALAWLLHLRDALGPSFRVHRSEAALMLSSSEPAVDEANADAIEAMRKRVSRWVGRMVVPSPHCVIVSFVEDEMACERLGAGPFLRGSDDVPEVFSIHVTSSIDARSIEPALVREFASSALSAAPMPAWLREGLVAHAVQELAGDPEFRWIDAGMHEAFWDDAEIQSFWTGEVFERGDDGAELGRDLARLLVAHLAERPQAFVEFVASARPADAGAQAARDGLGIDLGACACVLLGHEPAMSWSPRSFSAV